MSVIHLRVPMVLHHLNSLYHTPFFYSLPFFQPYCLKLSLSINPLCAVHIPQKENLKNKCCWKLQATNLCEKDQRKSRPALPRHNTNQFKQSPACLTDKKQNRFWFVCIWPLALLVCIRNSVTGWWKQGTLYHTVAEYHARHCSPVTPNVIWNGGCHFYFVLWDATSLMSTWSYFT